MIPHRLVPTLVAALTRGPTRRCAETHRAKSYARYADSWSRLHQGRHAIAHPGTPCPPDSDNAAMAMRIDALERFLDQRAALP